MQFMIHLETSVKVNSVEGTVERFKASVRANIKDINEVQKFIKDYSENNNETLKVATSRYIISYYVFITYELDLTPCIFCFGKELVLFIHKATRTMTVQPHMS